MTGRRYGVDGLYPKWISMHMMRRLLPIAALPFMAVSAHAQTIAANPVEPFSYGRHVGTASNPLYAAISAIAPSAAAASLQAAAPVELFSYGRRIGTQSNPLNITLAGGSSFLNTTGGNMTGAINWPSLAVGQSSYAPLSFTDTAGDNLTLTPVLGQGGANALLFYGTNHTPQINLGAAWASSVPVLTIGNDPTGAISGAIPLVPNSMAVNGALSAKSTITTEAGVVATYLTANGIGSTASGGNVTFTSPAAFNKGATVSGGATVDTMTVTGAVQLPQYTTANLPSCAVGQMAYATDARKLWSALSSAASNNGSTVYKDTSNIAATEAGMPVICTPLGSNGTPTWMPILINAQPLTSTN